MDGTSSASTSATRLPPVSSVYAASSLNAEITVFVLLTGILVGLLMVVVVLCVCKCCLKPNKPLKRQQVVFTKYSSEREESTWNGQKDSGGNSTGSGGRYVQAATPTGREASSPTKSPLCGDGGGDVDVELGVGSDNDLCEADDQNTELIMANRQAEERGSPLLEVMTFTATADNRVFQECSRESSSRNHRHQHDIINNHHPPLPPPPHHTTRHTRSSSPPRPTRVSRRVGHLPLISSCSTVEDDRIDGRRFPRSPPIQRQSPICSQTSDEFPSSPQRDILDDQSVSASVMTTSTVGGAPKESTEIIRATLASPEESSSLEEDTGCTGVANTTYKQVSAEVHAIPSDSASHPHPHHQRHTHGHHPHHPHQQVSPKDVLSSASTLFPRCVPKATSLSSRSLDEQKREPEVTLKRPLADIAADEVDSLVAAAHQRSLLRPASTSNIHDPVGSPPEIKHVPSTEDGVLEHMMELRRSENSRLLFSARRKKARGSPSSDDDDDDVGPRSKVRYNDTGSREEVNEEVLDLLLMTTEKADVLITPPQDMTSEVRDSEALASSQSRKLWELRATFEEDEELSDTLRMDEVDPIEEDQTDDCGNACGTKDTSNCEKMLAEPTDQEAGQDEATVLEQPKQCCGCAPQPASSSVAVESSTATALGSTAPPQLLTLPAAYESRRQSYKNILSKRVKKKLESSSLEQSTSVDNSFDSVETTTEGSSTDASRLEAISTSMESTTDNTDSTGDGQIHHRLQQMKHDSGYKSLETANGSKSTVKKQIHLVVEDDGSMPSTSTSELTEFDVAAAAASLELPIKMTAVSTPTVAVVEQRPPPSVAAGSRHLVRDVDMRGGSGKTASKKRREYTRERQLVETSFGTDMSGQDMDSSLDDGQQQQQQQGKSSVFVRFFQSSDQMRPNRRSSSMTASRPLNRDFSIDEKSDSLFREFSRREQPILQTSTAVATTGTTGVLDSTSGPRCKSPRLHSRHHRLYHHRHHHHHHHHPLDGEPTGGTGTGSGCVGVVGSGHIRSSKLSPQDSIEEEKRSVDAEDACFVLDELHSTAEIPIIKVAAEDSS